ncbi:MAG TPA: hypothetical protein ENK16_02865 [Chromatiales bacterium]|nr:hypothetical protein [Chromatiales bacterium]
MRGKRASRLGWLLVCTAGPLVAANPPADDTLAPDIEFLEYLGLEADSQWDEFFDEMAPEVAGTPSEPDKAPEDDDEQV